MRYTITLLLVLMSFALAAQVGMNVNTPEGSVNMSITGMPTGPQPCAPANQSTIDKIVENLEKLEKEVHVKLNKLDKKKADKLMYEIYDLLGQLQAAPVAAPVTPVATSASSSASASSSSSSSSSSSGTANININISGMEGQNTPPSNPHHNDNDYNQGHNNPPHHQDSATPKPMPDSDFSNLISKIKGESFSDNQMRVLRTAAKNYNFSCGQIIRVLDCFTFSEDKITALGITYPKVTDPKNNFNILDSFTYSADKEAAEDIMD